MNSILIPESLLHEKTYNADKYFNERFPSDYATMEANPNYSESGCGIAVTASDTENTLSIKDPADSSKELCKLTYSNGKLKFTYKKPAMVNNITMVGVGSTEKLNILDNNFDILHLNVVKKLGGVHIPNTSFDSLVSVCYGNGKFVAISNAGGDTLSDIFAYSTDGITWTQGTMPSSQQWYSVCYGNGKYVAIAGGSTGSNVFAYSTDGITWAQGTMPSNHWWYSVCYGNNKYVAIAYGSNVFAYSTDGINWTEGTMPSSQWWISVCYGNGKFVAISNAGGDTLSDIFAYSTDGITWTESTMPSAQDWTSVCYGNGKFIAIAAGTTSFAYSTDGISWTAGSMSDSSQWMSVCYGNGKYVAVAYNDNNIMFAYSYNGYKWYTVALDQSLYKDGIYHNYSSVCYSPDHNFFVTVSSPAIISIPDAYAGGVCKTFAVEYSWSGAIPSGVTLPNPTSYTSGATVTVDTKYTSDSIVDGIDFTNWDGSTSIPNSSTSTYFLKGCYGNGIYVLLNNIVSNPHVYYSTDTITWNKALLPAITYWTAICYGGGKFVAIGSTNGSVTSYGKVGAYSTDGSNWTQIELPSHNWREICYGNGMFVAVAYNDSNYIAYSSDGINWTEKSLSSIGSHGSVNSIFYGNGKFVIIEGRQYIYYSSDGINWTLGNIENDSTNSRNLFSGCYGNGKYVLIGDQGNGSNNVFYSTDLVNWTGIHAANTGKYCNNIIFTGLYFIALCSTTLGSTIKYDMIMYSMNGIEWKTIKANVIDSNINYGLVLIYGNNTIIYSGISTYSNQTQYISHLTLPTYYYQFSGWNKSGTFNITSDTSITGRWTQKSKLSVTYSWTNAPTGMTSTVPAKVTGLMPNETVAVDTKYTNKSAYKDTTNKKYYKFSGWNKSGEFNITSNTNISGSWDNGTSAPSMGGDFSSLTVGSTFFLGKYQVENETPWDIEWEIVHQTDNYQIAMTKQIIDLRSFDGAEPTNTDSRRKTTGNNNWSVSNIEQFLNSDQANWYSAQHQYDAPPNSANCAHYDNGTTYNAYDTHKGFLYYWSTDEKALLRDMTLTLANPDVDGGGSYTWTGKVWLPTLTQMGGGQNNGISEGEAFSKFTDNTSRIKSLHPNCIANNEYAKVNNYASGKTHWYWMSSANPSNSYFVRDVSVSGSFGSIDNTAAYSGFGFAPCICIPRTGSFGTPSDLNYVD